MLRLPHPKNPILMRSFAPIILLYELALIENVLDVIAVPANPAEALPQKFLLDKFLSIIIMLI
jgi:hypothetical protein